MIFPGSKGINVTAERKVLSKLMICKTTKLCVYVLFIGRERQVETDRLGCNQDAGLEVSPPFA